MKEKEQTSESVTGEMCCMYGFRSLLVYKKCWKSRGTVARTLSFDLFSQLPVLFHSPLSRLAARRLCSRIQHGGWVVAKEARVHCGRPRLCVV
jgi:hypothetical protein